MKTKLSIIGLVTMLSFAFVAVSAQNDEPAVKILPTTQKGIIKLLYAYDADQSVQVTFSNEAGLIITDNIKASRFEHGFSKKYDVRNIQTEVFWIEVKAPKMSATYRVTESNDGSFVSVLEKTTYNHDLVAANN